jgi:TM2 domain-containing membrane protein YozV
MTRKTEANIPLAGLAGVLAWIIPGAGHICIGRPVRGIILCLTIAATFWAGVAMGGVMTVDPENEHWWFIADLFTGVHGLAAWQLQQHTWRGLVDPDVRQRQAALSHDPAEATAVMDQKLQERGLALTSPTDTVARAYSGIAGLLNIMCIFDAIILSLMGIPAEPTAPAEAVKGPGGPS